MSFRALVSTAVVLVCASVSAASTVKFGAALAPTQSSATGVGWSSIELDLDTHTMLYRIGFAATRGTSTAATLRGPTAEANTGTADAMTLLPNLTGFPLGVSSANYEHLFDMTQAANYNPAFLNNAANGGDVNAAFNALKDALTDSKAYVRIDTTRFPDGELSGFYKVVPPVPEPAALSLAGVLAIGRRRR